MSAESKLYTEENDNIVNEFNDNECEDNPYSKKCNDIKLKKELLERNVLENEKEDDELYPSLNDPNFIIKIAEKKEFADYKYDGEIDEIKIKAEKLNTNTDFQLSPHQIFVKNFLSFQTPYNSLLLYHGLGTGKTCSAIGVCEEQRDYFKQMGIAKKIIIVASPNVQDNFRLQLFDERKLENKNGYWKISGCIGNKLLKEVNPMNMKGIPRDKIINQINILINQSYSFKGYQEFANLIENTQKVQNYNSEKERKLRMQRKLKFEFDGRLIVIDEVHNLNEDKKLASQLIDVVMAASNLRLLLLSATPMYNSHKEIIWLLNLMNMNDGRALIRPQDIFDKDGKIKEKGKELLIRKATGYISFVRGENPYTFPYRVYPNIFSPENTFDVLKYPYFQLNKKVINPDTINYLLNNNIYQLEIGSYQNKGYNAIINNIQYQKDIDNVNFEKLDSFGFKMLQKPLESLVIVYPSKDLDRYINENSGNSEDNNNDTTIIDIKPLIGKKGLTEVMSYVDSVDKKTDFEYKKDILENPLHGNIFSPERIGKYSSKIKNICDSIYSPATNKVSDGVILIYCQYLDGGLIPMALALEEMGFTRYGKNPKNLFKTPPNPLINVKTFQPIEKNKKNINVARYAMITGDPRLSPDNDYEIKGVTSDKNVDGGDVKVILISRAASEGIDLKFIRQLHIMDPWYNFNRIEQIIGRGVRNYSHILLPFEKRNVQLFLYGTKLNSDIEAADNYVYRLASYKAIQIGKVSRILKETAVDCIINYEQTNFTQAKIEENTEDDVTQILSSGKIINDFKVGDIPYSFNCDYMTCDYNCIPNKNINNEDINEYTFNESFINVNSDQIQEKIKKLFKEKYYYTKKDLIQRINISHFYPLPEIYAALTQMINDSNEIIIDKYDRVGHLINIDEYYLYQPNVLNNNNESLFNRSVPLDYKFKMLNLNIKKDLSPVVEEDNSSINILNDIKNKYDTAIKYGTGSDKVPRGDKDEYKYWGQAIRYLTDNKIIELNTCEELLIHHLIDMLIYSDKLKILSYIYSKTIIEDDSLESKIKDYLHTQTAKIKGKTNIVMYKNKEQIIKTLKDNQWIDATYIEKKNVNDELKDLETIRDISNPIGFIGYDDKKDIMIFKIKYFVENKSIGRKCSDQDKSKQLNVLNDIQDHIIYTNENSKGLVKFYLCALEELFFRYNNKINKNGKAWFFTYEETFLFNEELKL